MPIGEDCKQQGIADHFEHGFVLKELRVVHEGKRTCRSDRIGIEKTVNGKQQNGGVKKKQYKPDETRFQATKRNAFFVHNEVPLTFSSGRNPPESRVETMTTISRMSAIIEPICQSVPK